MVVRALRLWTCGLMMKGDFPWRVRGDLYTTSSQGVSCSPPAAFLLAWLQPMRTEAVR